MTSETTLFSLRYNILALILTLNLLTTNIVAPLSNDSKWQMGFNSAFKGLKNVKFIDVGINTEDDFENCISNGQVSWVFSISLYTFF